MVDPEACRRYSDELERRLRLRTYPIALSMVRDATALPPGAIRPLRDLGYHLSLCQAFQLSRREGKTVAMLAEDHWCCEPVIGYGLGEPPPDFFEGRNRYPGDVATLEAGQTYARELPRLPVGEYAGTVCGPLASASFEPDLVIVYCDPSQLSLLLLAREYADGDNLGCALSAHAACVYSVVPALTSGRCQVAVPCGGDRYRAMAGDDEMVFSAPYRRLDELLLGIRSIEHAGRRLPSGHSFLPEYPLPESYRRIADEMGYLGPPARPLDPGQHPGALGVDSGVRS